MDEVHCVIAVISSEVAKFEMPQINAVTTSFLYVCRSCGEGSKMLETLTPPALPVALEGLRRCGNDGAKIQLFFDIKQKKIFPRSQHSKKVTKVTTYFSKSHGELLRVMEGFFQRNVAKNIENEKRFCQFKIISYLCILLENK